MYWCADSLPTDILSKTLAVLLARRSFSEVRSLLVLSICEGSKGYPVMLPTDMLPPGEMRRARGVLSCFRRFLPARQRGPACVAP